MKCEMWCRNRKHKEYNKMKITEYMSPVQFSKLYFALKNAITKEAGSLQFCGARCHGACSSFVTKERMRVYVSMWYTSQGVWPVPTSHIAPGGCPFRSEQWALRWRQGKPSSLIGASNITLMIAPCYSMSHAYSSAAGGGLRAKVLKISHFA